MTRSAHSPAHGNWNTATARDGASLAYRVTAGEGPGRCVLVHSLAMDATFWDRVLPLLAPYGDVITYDCRGHGRSDKPQGPYTVELFADDLADVMKHAGWDSAVVAGASMGGCVALAFAAAYPERTEGLGLFDTTSWYGPNAPAQWRERGQKARDEGMGALVGFQKSRWFSEGFLETDPGVVEDAVAVFLANDVPAYAATCDMLGAADIRHALPSFAFPCHILVGEHDYATPPEMARAMADAIPGARMRVVDEVRHFTPLEVPEEIAAELIALLEAGS